MKRIRLIALIILCSAVATFAPTYKGNIGVDQADTASGYKTNIGADQTDTAGAPPAAGGQVIMVEMQ